ncbi:uncharacterized protein BDR25DRAFT_340453 [Lindgomyces ingoldianus]|uniref:Uncharacterized protein n=1 Tax=Lindgomyces ingoldianus TaxID=673940 RepID=A0ACB6R7I0_9PLEO|nr:uncharacterized protein BDR25DRAFT_340453 [Lindgomyces ingoldianus]KAF2474700.1 hypothetical protein BDR25DRAFT_340453 [Lindgomyces ingoldianus]
MDPLSFSASLITVLGLAAKVGKKAKQIVDDTKDAPAELTEIRDEIESLTWVIERLDALSKEEARANPTRPILWSRNASRTTDIEIALGSCTNVMKELSRRLDAVEGYLTGGVFDKMKYPFFVSSERNNLRDLRLRTLGLVKAASSASVEHHGAIQELLKLVRSLQSQDELDGVPGIPQTIERATPISSGLTGSTAVSDGDGCEGTDSVNSNTSTTFELEVYSSPDAWISRFR